jgi:hypothetical protein
MGTKKRQYSFHADEDVADYLDSLESGLKTKRINELIRHGIGVATSPAEPSALEIRLREIESRVSSLEYHVATPEGRDKMWADLIGGSDKEPCPACNLKYIHNSNCPLG